MQSLSDGAECLPSILEWVSSQLKVFVFTEQWNSEVINGQKCEIVSIRCFFLSRKVRVCLSFEKCVSVLDCLRGDLDLDSRL